MLREKRYQLRDEKNSEEFKTKSDYSYQKEIGYKCLKAALSKGEALCAVACGGGKSRIAALVIEKFLSDNPDKSVVFIAENNKALASQFKESLENLGLSRRWSAGDFHSMAQIKVGVFASLHKLQDRPGLVLIDEAHRQVSGKRYRLFRSRCQMPTVYMTGTPFLFQKITMPRFYISGEELQNRGVYSGLDLDVLRTDKTNPKKVIDDFLKSAMAKRDNISKVLVACPTIAFAEKVADYLQILGHEVFLSTSKHDPDNAVLNSSKKQLRGFVVTVSKASLGYDDPSIRTLLDLRSSKDLAASMQVFARVLRRAPDQSRKTYYRVSNTDGKSYNAEVLALHKLVALTQRDIYRQFNGRNLKLECV